MASPRCQHEWKGRPVVELPRHLVGDGPCQRCDGVNVRWSTESAFWNSVIAEWKGDEWTGYDPGGIFCISCFVTIVDEVGYAVPAYELKPAWRWQKR